MEACLAGGEFCRPDAAAWSPGLYVSRAARGHRDHRDSVGPSLACGECCSRSGPPHAVPEPSSQSRPSAPPARVGQRLSADRGLGLRLDRRRRSRLRPQAAGRMALLHSSLYRAGRLSQVGAGLSTTTSPTKSHATVTLITTPLEVFHCPSRRPVQLYTNFNDQYNSEGAPRRLPTSTMRATAAIPASRCHADSFQPEQPLRQGDVRRSGRRSTFEHRRHPPAQPVQDGA